MQKINQIFNDIYFSTRILANATRLRDTLEYTRDNELDLIGNEEEKALITEQYRKKLQSVYRIRNNAYSYLLKNGFQCTYKIDETDNSKIFYMNIEGTVYDCKESAIKNILGKEYEETVKYCLSEEEFAKIASENKKEVVDIKKDTVTLNEKTVNLNKEESSQNDLLDSFIDFNEMIDLIPQNTTKKQVNVEAPSNVIPVFDEIPTKTEEKPMVEEPLVESAKEEPKKINRCSRCFAPMDENETTCGFCGYNINASTKLSKEEFDAMDDTDDFSEEDIDKMFEELEKRLNALNEEKTVTTTTTISLDTSKPDLVTEEPEDNETVRLYNPEKSEPSKKRSEMIMDVYTLKLKDPKPDVDETEAVPEVQKRMRKSALLEANNIEEEEEDDSIVREIKIYIYPLSVPETGTELSSEILIYITQDNACGAFCSPISGVNSVKVNTNIHNFIVRGQWDNGNFITKVIPNGKTLLDNCEIERKKETIRPEDIIAAKLGHPVTFLSIEYVDGTETMKIHAVPLSDTNELDGYTRTLYLMENINQKERKIFMTKNNTNHITFEFEDEIYKATSKWDNDKFKMKVENY